MGSENDTSAGVSRATSLRRSTTSLASLLILGRGLSQHHACHRVIVQHLLVFVCRILRCLCLLKACSHLSLVLLFSLLLGHALSFLRLGSLSFGISLRFDSQSLSFFGLGAFTLCVSLSLLGDASLFFCFSTLSCGVLFSLDSCTFSGFCLQALTLGVFGSFLS